MHEKLGPPAILGVGNPRKQGFELGETVAGLCGGAKLGDLPVFPPIFYGLCT